MLVWILTIGIGAVVVGLSIWASRGRGASDAERSSSWGRGPSGGSGL